MTTTYDPRHVLYADEYDVRLETARVLDVCMSCRQCVALCPTFPTLISLVQSKVDADAGRLTPLEQDDVMRQCFRCTICSATCPYTPDQHEHAIDFPRLVDRYRAMQKKQKTWSMRSRLGHLILGRAWRWTRLLARLTPGGAGRQFVSRLLGISQRAEIPRRAPKSFSALMSTRVGLASRKVSVFPTCVVETVKPEIGQALVEVYEHYGINCSLVAPDRCCGAPALLHGEITAFMKNAIHNVAVLSKVVRDGHEIVVPNPSCYSVITNDYPHYLDTDDSRLVASHTFESLDYLVQSVDESERLPLLMAGAQVVDVPFNAGREAGWHLHVDNEITAETLALEFQKKIAATGADVVVSDSPWVAGFAGVSALGDVVHPFEVLARARGLSPGHEEND